MATIKAGNITKNSFILYKNQPHRVVKADFYSPGKGSALMRVKMKSAITGTGAEFTYKTSETVEEVDVTKKEMQFLYADDAEVTFMDERTFEQVAVDRELVEDKLGVLIAEIRVNVMFYQDKAIGILLPPNVTLTVTEAQDAVAGNRVNAPKKPVILETGLEVMVPLFIKTGDKVIVDTDTLLYSARSTI